MTSTTDTLAHKEDVFEALYQAILSIAGAETLDRVLQRIVDSARELVDAEYGAIGIFSEDRKLSGLITSGEGAEVMQQVAESAADLKALSDVVTDNHPIRLILSSEVSRAAGLPAGHPRMDSLLAVPIVAESEVLGNLYLTNKTTAPAFSDEDEKLVQMLAAHAAAAIRKARLLEIQNHYSLQLMRRNSQLAALNQAVMAVTSELTLVRVLQEIVDSARLLVSAQYGALGVPNQEGGLDTFVYSGISEDQARKMPHFPKGLGLLGAIARERRPIRVATISADPRSAGFPAGHPPMRSFLGLPIMVGGQVMGNLYLTDKIGADEFTAEDQEMLEMLAAHAAIVIQNSRLYEQVGRLAIVAERARIGMDLHDGVIQSIFAVGLTLESARLIMSENQAEADQLLENAITGLNSTIRDIRNFILDLRPHRFSGNLEQGMGRLVREFQANTMVPVELNMVIDSSLNLPPAVSRAVFLTAQEALANVARHAKASKVIVEARRGKSTIELSVEDDGRGFDSKLQVQTVGHGLSNMKARAESLKGTMTLNTAPGKGTKITLSLPCC